MKNKFTTPRVLVLYRSEIEELLNMGEALKAGVRSRGDKGCEDYNR